MSFEMSDFFIASAADVLVNLIGVDVTCVDVGVTVVEQQ